ncbi:hypothetical protein GDO81_029682 [Engystomops pustulosus]|uniref:Uncharacterized protein n=1 Tax=Engystomops pustulosus TaxID=76066 RepID=A0AAV6ZCE1_ENGPU|nr:hypothetical protein GDO81_029682 [Engystomops pustulosus]
MTGSQTLLPYFTVQFNKMGSFRRPRPRFMSSPALSDLPRFYAGRQSVQLNSSAMWNSVQNAVINVFKGGGLQANELYSLNENIRYGGQELTIRQIALLGFRDAVLLKVNLERTLPLMKSPVPPPILQMLLVLQSDGYLKLEDLVKMVVSRIWQHHRFPKCHLRSDSTPYTPLGGSSLPAERCLSPLTEQEGEAYLEKCGSIRRHTVANVHTDIQLLAMASIMHPRSEEAELSSSCLLLQPSFTQRQFSSEPNIVDCPSEMLQDSSEDSSPSPS